MSDISAFDSLATGPAVPESLEIDEVSLSDELELDETGTLGILLTSDFTEVDPGTRNAETTSVGEFTVERGPLEFPDNTSTGELTQAGKVEEAIQGITVISGDEDSSEEVDLSPENASDEDAPIVKLVNLILQEAIKERATDIHVEPQEDKVNVRIRIDGVLQIIMTPPATSLSGLVTRIKILSKLNIAEKRLPFLNQILLVLTVLSHSDLSIFWFSAFSFVSLTTGSTNFFCSSTKVLRSLSASAFNNSLPNSTSSSSNLS